MAILLLALVAGAGAVVFSWVLLCRVLVVLGCSVKVLMVLGVS
jgi:hypothetical protein